MPTVGVTRAAPPACGSSPGPPLSRLRCGPKTCRQLQRPSENTGATTHLPLGHEQFRQLLQVAQVLKALDVVVLQMEVSHSSGDPLNFSDAIVVQVQRTKCMKLQQVRLRDHNMPRQVAQPTHHGLPTVQALRANARSS